MRQELGETVQAMMDDDLKQIQDVLNKRPSGTYWILMHHKPTKFQLSTGQRIIKKVVRVCDKEPQDLIGTIVFKVQDGQVVDIKSNLHDAPINWSLIEPIAGFSNDPLVQKKQIAKEYFYNE